MLEKAGIPYMGGSPQLGEELTAAGSFMLTGGTVADLLGQADYALDALKAKKIGALYVDLPGVLTTVVKASEVVLRLKGATDVKLVAAKADEADFAPALKAVSKSEPDVIFVVFPAQSCARIMQTAKSLGVTAKMFYPSAARRERGRRRRGRGRERLLRVRLPAVRRPLARGADVAGADEGRVGPLPGRVQRGHGPARLLTSSPAPTSPRRGHRRPKATKDQPGSWPTPTRATASRSRC